MRVNQRKDDLTEVDLDMAALLPGAMIKLI